MNTKKELKGCLRRARADMSLRKSLLHDARFSKELSGWFALVFALCLLGEIASDGGRWLSGSGTMLANLIFCVMICDKFADRVAMLESLEEEGKQPPV